jgi:hypothetical protein
VWIARSDFKFGILKSVRGESLEMKLGVNF